MQSYCQEEYVGKTCPEIYYFNVKWVKNYPAIKAGSSAKDCLISNSCY